PNGILLSTIGSVLVGVAVLLVGVVAWVNDGIPFARKRAEDFVPAADGEGDTPIRTRAARSRSAQQAQAATSTKRSVVKTLQAAGLRYSVARTRLGWYGTAAGLLVAFALGVWLALILRSDWYNPLAGWLWPAIMLVLLVTFAGVRPWPAGAGLMAHDPAEPAF